MQLLLVVVSVFWMVSMELLCTFYCFMRWLCSKGVVRWLLGCSWLLLGHC